LGIKRPWGLGHQKTLGPWASKDPGVLGIKRPWGLGYQKTLGPWVSKDPGALGIKRPTQKDHGGHAHKGLRAIKNKPYDDLARPFLFRV